ncbi:hypothetical protein FACS1894219_09360 [Clostridia bacterium]|nr:hypothetical protein FACS1894219_09360 [Clostridia bacterium]
MLVSAEYLHTAVFCFVAYIFPETVSQLPNGAAILTDIVVSFSLSSVSLGVTLFVHFHLYKEQQRKLEATREKTLHLSKVKSNFLENMRHEIRMPINIMLGMNEMILRESDSTGVKDNGLNVENAEKSLLLLERV